MMQSELMRNLLSFLITLCFPILLLAQNPKSITIGLIPGENPEVLRKNGQELADILSKKLGVAIQVHVSKDYSSLIEAMKNKEVDFAFFTAMSFVFAEKKANAKVLLKKVWNGPYYYSVVLIKKNKKINSLKNLKGKRFAFVDEKSTSGYLYPMVQFKKIGLQKEDFSEVIFSGNHQASVSLLQNDKVDAIAVFSDDPKGKTSAWKQFSPKSSAQQRVLWTSEPIPNDPFCVRKDFYDKYPRFAHDIMFELIDLKDEPGNPLKKLLGVEELKLATTKQYEPVREMVKELNLQLE